MATSKKTPQKYSSTSQTSQSTTQQQSQTSKTLNAELMNQILAGLQGGMTDEEIADILRDVDDLVRWAKMIKDYAQDEAVSHDHFIPGYKLV